MFTVSCDCVSRMATLFVHVPNPAGIGENTEHEEKGFAFPNPSQGQFSIEGSGLVTVTTLLGQIVMTDWIDGKASFVLPKGIYLVRLESGNTISIDKLIVR